MASLCSSIPDLFGTGRFCVNLVFTLHLYHVPWRKLSMPLPSLRCALAAALIFLPLSNLIAQSADPTSETATMQRVEDSWDTAVAKHDQFAMENLLSRDFVGIGADGDITTRNQQIAHLFVTGAEPLSLTQKVIGARVMGDVAVVNGTYVMQWQNGAQKIAEKGVFTHIFRHNAAGNWQCINSQRTVVATEDERKKAAAVHSKSNDQLPLHIPLVYKGPKSTQPAPQPGANAPQP
jgi:ketosteroid isomerase-like protein